MAKKVAILGGGIGALMAACELTDDPATRGDFDVTVYQIGWRLGGKGATSRNRSMASRIEEHGIHFLLGFYENAFHLIRRVYDEYLPRHESPFDTWTDAFRKQNTITAMVNDDGQWWPFGARFVETGELPGDPDRFVTDAGAPTPWDLLRALFAWLQQQPAVLGSATAFGVDPTVNILVQELQTDLTTANELAKRHAGPPAPDDDAVDDLTALMNKSTEVIAALIQTPGTGRYAREYLKLLDVGTAVARGMIRDGVVWRGFGAIDEFEFRAWLQRNGCSHADCAVIRSGYDACFAYAHGDAEQPSMSAGVALHGGMRLWFTYRGAIFWPMQAGMAEVIFAPFYRVLRDRGVHFKFFHRVMRLVPSPDGRSLDAIEIDVQARTKHASAEYEPLIRVKGLECWPEAPLYEQLEDAASIQGDMESAWAAPPAVDRATLVRGRDFDDAILGISRGALPFICGDLIACSPAWQRMLPGTPTVQTQALQLWIHATAAELGFDAGVPGGTPDAACVSAFVKPFDTYGDLSALREREAWRPEDGVRQLAYFCTTLPDTLQIPAPGADPHFPTSEHRRAFIAARDFVLNNLGTLWPYAETTGGFDWQLLVDRTGGLGEERLTAQYVRANIDPSARYVLSPPQTMTARLLPDASGFDHLFLAGDWTYTPMSSGCVEAATMSGRRAAQAVSGRYVPIYGWSRTDPMAAWAAAATSATSAR